MVLLLVMLIFIGFLKVDINNFYSTLFINSINIYWGPAIYHVTTATEDMFDDEMFKYMH